MIASCKMILPRSCWYVLQRGYASSNSIFETAVNDKTGVATVTMNNPPVNAMTLDFINTFCETMNDLEKNKSRGIILTSALKNVFCAGLDINEFHKPDKAKLTHYYSIFQECWLKLYGSSFPTVAAVNGHAPAGGCMMALSTEYRVMKNKYTIGLNEVILGIVAPAWLMNTMTMTIPPRTAELALTLGKLFTTEEALQIGMIDVAVNDNEELMNKAQEIINPFTKINPQARSNTKAVFRQKVLKEFLETREQDKETFVSTVMSPPAQEQIDGYLKVLKSKSKG